MQRTIRFPLPPTEEQRAALYETMQQYRVWPADSVSDVIKEIKGITTFELRKKHTQLLKLPSMRTRSYFAATVGSVSAAIIQQYLAAQKGL